MPTLDELKAFINSLAADQTVIPIIVFNGDCESSGDPGNGGGGDPDPNPEPSGNWYRVTDNRARLFENHDLGSILSVDDAIKNGEAVKIGTVFEAQYDFGNVVACPSFPAAVGKWVRMDDLEIAPDLN